MKKILFVCTGNTCRSPMAAAIMNKLLKEEGLGGYLAESAGLAAMEGMPASKNAVQAMKDIGLDISGHRSRRATAELLKESAGVYAMELQHKAALEAYFPECKGRTEVLGGGIPDPFGGSLEVYRACRDDILEVLKGIISSYK